MSKSKNLLLICCSMALIVSQPSLQQTYTFPFNPSQEDLTQSPSYYGMHSLGVLSVGQSITVTITAPNTPNAATSQVLSYLIHIMRLVYYDLMSTPIWKPAGSFSNLISTTPSSYSATYSVNFPTGSTLTSANFKLFVIDFTYGIEYFYEHMGFFHLKVVSFNSTQPSSQTTLVQATDTMRIDTMKIVYAQNDNEVFNMTLSPVSNPPPTFPDGTSAANPEIMIHSIPEITSGTLVGSNLWGIVFIGSFVNPYYPSNERLAALSHPVYVNNVAHYTYIAPKKGFYIFEVYISPSVKSLLKSFTFTWRTDPFACPYNPAYPDVYQSFQGCTIVNTTGTAGLPCVNFDQAFGVCTKCLNQYALVNGSCFANTTCPPRQYFSYGSCFNVSDACGAFDAFTGNCLNCSDSEGYTLGNGSCLRKNITCASNQWKLDFTCINASTLCGTFDPSNGNCLTCISNLYKLSIDGTCSPITVNCPQGQYAVGLDCLTISSQCLNFNSILGKCLSCIKGYFVQDEGCRRIECPHGQVPSGFAMFCADVSPLCQTYDPISGDCLSCSSAGYTIRNGKCIQTISPLAGCKEREILGFGACVGADKYCRTFNLITNSCDECNTGYYLDYTGHCALKANCGINQWSVGGQCIDTPENCLKVDSLGFCTKCVSSNYRLVQGQCVFFQSCQQRQYINSAGQCVDVSPSCSTWNPSNGQCITCRDASTQPSGGVCCPLGQIFLSGACTDSRTTNSSPCITPHPSFNICLSCAENYSPDYSIPYGCSAN